VLVLVCVVVLLGLGVPASTAAQKGKKGGAATPGSTGGDPNITSALKALEQAKKSAAAAPHTFGGHREKAAEAINHAIHQLNEALAYARNHPSSSKDSKKKGGKKGAKKGGKKSESASTNARKGKKGGGAATGHAKGDPNITSALKALEQAKKSAAAAPHTFDGHRAKAAEIIDHAIHQLNEALAYARTSSSPKKGGKKK
jgi:hypothetical protein